MLPDYQLKLSVKKHGDVDVLIAAVDCAYFTATKVEEGRIMYKLLMKVTQVSWVVDASLQQLLFRCATRKSSMQEST